MLSTETREAQNMKFKLALLLCSVLVALSIFADKVISAEDKVLPHGLKWGVSKKLCYEQIKNSTGVNGYKYAGYADLYLGKKARRDVTFADDKMIGYDLDFEFQNHTLARSFTLKLIRHYKTRYGPGKATDKADHAWIVGNTAIIVLVGFTDVHTAHVAFRPTEYPVGK